MKKKIALFLALMLVLPLLAVEVFAATSSFTVLNGNLTVSYTTSKGRDAVTKASETSISGTVQSAMFSGGTVKITMTNNLTTDATLSFEYSISGSGLSSSTLDSSGTKFSQQLASGGEYSFTVKGSGSMGKDDVTISISNISLLAVQDTSQVTVTYDSNYGTVSTSSGTVTSGSILEGSTTQSISLTATSTNGGTFLGWFNADTHEVLEMGTTYTIAPTNDVSVKAAFIGPNSAPYFYVGGGAAQSQSFGFLGLSSFTYYTVPSTNYMYLYDDLNDAATAAQSSSTAKYVVLANSGTLAAGTYTIPAGVTLLIPFDSANSCYTVNAQWGGETMTTPTAYRTLTMASGANLVINGAMSVSGKHAFTNSGGQSGSPSGALGFVRMNSDSSITVNNGGGLYAYGYIIGSGTVTAKSGATVYEIMQMPEFRGGSQSTGMDNDVFPLSQFYIQNIEVPLTLEAGAVEYAYGTLFASSSYFKTGAYLIGSSSTSGMFTIQSGSVTKRYDGTADRIYINIDGAVEMASINLQVDTSSINSKEFVLPINGGYTITLEEDSSLTVPSTQRLLLQPGAQLIIKNGATCTVNSALYIYDAAQWGAYSNWGHAGAGDSNCWDTPVIPVSYSPTRTYVRPHVFPRGLFTDSSGNPIYITEDPAIYEKIFGENKGDCIAEADLAEFLANHLSDASILVNGTLYGNIYTTAGGANIYSTGSGQFTQTATANSSVWQLMMGADYSFNSGNGEYYVEAISSPATLQNGGDRGVVNSIAGTYNYNSTTKRWECKTHTYNDGAVTDPTFEADGYTTYTCTVCDHTYVETNTGSKLVAIAEVDGEKFASLTAALDAVRDGGTVTLLSTPEADVVVAQCVTIDTANTDYTVVCGDGWAIDNKGNGIFLVKNPNLFCIYGTSVKAGDSLDIYFYIQSTDLTGEGYYAEILRTRAGADSEKVTVPYSKWSKSGSYMRFSYDDIAAKEMTDEVYVTIYNANHQPVSNTFCESVERYAVRVLNGNVNAADGTKEAALRTALVDMLNYGAGCQDFFNDYNINDLANARIDSFQKHATENVTYTKHETHGDHFYGPTITAENSLYLTFYFADIADPIGMRAVVTYKDHYGNDVGIEVDYTDFRTRSSYYGIDVTGLAVADGRQPILCTVYNADGTIFSETTCSVECYAAIAIAINTVDDAITKDGLVFVNLMKFVDSARAYFHYSAS